MHEIMRHFAARLFYKTDVIRGSHQILVATEDIEKTAVTTPFGPFEFLCLSFGLYSAVQTFQKFIDSITRELDSVYVHIGDILIALPNVDEHIQHLTSLL